MALKKRILTHKKVYLSGNSCNKILNERGVNQVKINTKRDGTKLTIELDGKLNVDTSQELDDVIKGNIDGVTELVFDMAEVEYISSSGIRVIFETQKTMMKQGSMVLKNVNDDVREVFDITGLSTIMTIE